MLCLYRRRCGAGPTGRSASRWPQQDSEAYVPWACRAWRPRCTSTIRSQGGPAVGANPGSMGRVPSARRGLRASSPPACTQELTPAGRGAAGRPQGTAAHDGRRLGFSWTGATSRLRRPLARSASLAGRRHGWLDPSGRHQGVTRRLGTGAGWTSQHGAAAGTAPGGRWLPPPAGHHRRPAGRAGRGPASGRRNLGVLLADAIPWSGCPDGPALLGPVTRLRALLRGPPDARQCAGTGIATRPGRPGGPCCCVSTVPGSGLRLSTEIIRSGDDPAATWCWPVARREPGAASRRLPSAAAAAVASGGRSDALVEGQTVLTTGSLGASADRSPRGWRAGRPAGDRIAWLAERLADAVAYYGVQLGRRIAVWSHPLPAPRSNTAGRFGSGLRRLDAGLARGCRNLRALGRR